jgi:hypothetical protein
MSLIYPFFFQYDVQPSRRHPQHDTFAGAIATIIVFAESSERGQARASRRVGRNNWQITDVKRSMLIESHHIDNLDGELKQLYTKAEQNGIAAVFDGWESTGVRHCYQG